MTKADLAEAVIERVGIPPEDAAKAVESILDAIVQALRFDDKVEVRWFGSFRIRQRNARIGRNPKTGARVNVPAKRVAFFKPGKELHDLVTNSKTALAASADPTTELA